MLLHPMTQIAACGSVLFRNPGLGRTILEQSGYLRLVHIQLTFANPFGAAQRHPLLLACGKSLHCSLRDQVSLNFCGHRKSHCHDLALNTVAQLPVAFDGIDTDAFLPT